MNSEVFRLIKFVFDRNGVNDKAKLSKLVAVEFGLTQDRSVYYCDYFAVRFSSSINNNFSNTVLSLSNLQKFDSKPFLVCLITPNSNYVYLANSSFLKKISHSSQALRVNNIRGSFNGSDIAKNFQGIENKPENFERLFHIHEAIGFDSNLIRLVEATNNISPHGEKFPLTEERKLVILDSPTRAQNFINSENFTTLKSELDKQVSEFKNEILLASLIENVNIRGRIIEYLIAGKNELLRKQLVTELLKGTGTIPQFKTDGQTKKVTNDVK